MRSSVWAILILFCLSIAFLKDTSAQESEENGILLRMKFSSFQANTLPSVYIYSSLDAEKMRSVAQYFSIENHRYYYFSGDTTAFRYPRTSADLVSHWIKKSVNDRQYELYETCLSELSSASYCDEQAVSAGADFLTEELSFLSQNSTEVIFERMSSELTGLVELFDSETIPPAIFVIKAMAFSSFEEGKQFIRDNRNALSWDQRRIAMQALGYMAKEGFQRELLKFDTKDRVTAEQIWMSARSQFIPDENLNYGEGAAGVSRHQGNFLATVAKEFGYENSYAIGFAVHGSAHGAAYWEDPEGNAYLIEFKDQSVQRGVTGPAVLNHLRDEFTNPVLAWRVSEPGGGGVRDIPSELQVRLVEMLFDEEEAQRLFPGYIDRGWSAVVKRGMNRVFAGQDSFGNFLVGYALAGMASGSADQLNHPSIFNARFAVGGFLQTFDKSQKSFHAIASVKMGLRTPQIHPNYDIGLRARYGLTVMGGQFYDRGTGNHNEFHGDFDTRAEIGIGGHLGNPMGCYLAEFEAYSEILPSFKNVLDPLHTIGAREERKVARLDGSVCLGRNEEGPTSGIKTRGLLLKDKIADAYLANFSYWNRGVRAQVGIQGSFSENPPLFHEGAQNYYTGELELTWRNKRLTLNGALPRDDNSKKKAGLGVHIPIGGRK